MRHMCTLGSRDFREHQTFRTSHAISSERDLTGTKLAPAYDRKGTVRVPTVYIPLFMKRKNNCIDMHPLVTDAKAAEVI
jgi:hypothetical protein